MSVAGDCSIPLSTAEAYSCGLDTPIDSGATSAAVVNLLQQGNTLIDQYAYTIVVNITGDDDAMALAITCFVANKLTYVSDGEGPGIGDRWTCPLATYKRGYGDCEDGALLIHSLMLAAGVNPNRIRTVFGKIIGIDLVEYGHSWVMYRRTTDEEWIPLDWTQGAAPYSSGVISSINRQCDLTSAYTTISYVLTDEAFSAVNDANYIPKLAANRSTAASVIPLVTVSGRIGLSATASLSLFQGPLDTTIAVSGLCAANASMAMPSASLTGTGMQETNAQGLAPLPSLSALASTGALATCIVSLPISTGQCGTSADGVIVLGALATDISAVTSAIVNGAMATPLLSSKAHGLSGLLGDGISVFKMPTLIAHSGHGPIAHGVATISHFFMSATGDIVSSCDGEIEIPIYLSAHGKQTSQYGTTPLVYDMSRTAA